MKTNKLLITISLFTTLSGCFSSELDFEDQFQPVLEAYLYMDKQVTDIHLSSMISFGSDSSGGDQITDADIYLDGENSSWKLVHDDSRPGFYASEFIPEMIPGDTFKLRIELEEGDLSAQTVIPRDPPAVSMSASNIYIPRVESMMEFRDLDMPDPVELSWNNPDASYYFLNIQNIENNPTAIMPDPPDNRPAPEGGFVFQMITEPTNNNYHLIDLRQLTYYGTYRIIMSSVNDEYVSLYNSLNQDSRELNEPFSNVENGLGIFTAFNSDTLYLEVIPIYQ